LSVHTLLFQQRSARLREDGIYACTDHRLEGLKLMLNVEIRTILFQL
jgi:hypothetical protein